MNELSLVELETLERWTLAQARQQLGPDSEQVTRILASVAAGLAPLGAPESSGLLNQAPETQTALPERDLTQPSLVKTITDPARFALIAGLGGIVLGLVLGLQVASNLAQKAPVEKSTRAALSGSLPGTSTPANGVASTKVEPPEAKPTAVEFAAPSLSPIETLPVAPRISARPYAARILHDSPDTQKAPPKLPLYEELTYLRRAQTAMKAGNFAQALGLMTELRSEAPHGALLSEREVTEILALCALGRTTEAQVVATRLRARDKKLAYQSRINSSCVGTNKSSAE